MSEPRDFLQRLFPDVRGDVCELLANAADNGLESVDFYTLRDLRELSGYDNTELLALLACLFLALREGSVCLEISAPSLARRLEGLLPPDAAAALAARLAILLDKNPFSELIAGADDDGEIAATPVLLRTTGTRRLLYFQKYLQAERLLQRLLEQRLQQAPVLTDDTLASTAAAEVFKDTTGHALNDEQQLAAALALLRNFVIVSGGPGTGKTSVVFALLRCLLRTGVAPERMALACPTGRAAQRLTEALRRGLQQIKPGCDAALSTLEAQTVHRLLGFRPGSGLFIHHRDNPLPYDLIVIDEVSMLDIVAMARVLEAAAPETKLILLGDKDQLPSVDAGAVLADLLPQSAAPGFSTPLARRLEKLVRRPVPAAANAAALQDSSVMLRRNYRSQPQIQMLAESIRAVTRPDHAQKIAQDLPRLQLDAAWPDKRLQAGGCWLLEQSTAAAWRDTLEQWSAQYFGVEYLELAIKTCAPETDSDPGALQRIFAAVNRARILTLLREGPWGSAGVNETILRAIRGRLKLPVRTQRFAGAPVMVTSNDYNLQLFNGDVGVLLENADGTLRAVFERPRAGGRGHVAVPLETLPAHELAFAVTVHKAQGSEFDEILLALPPQGARRLLNRQMIYTAITRAKNIALISARNETLAEALGRTLERHSGLSFTAADSASKPAAAQKSGQGLLF